MATQIGTVSVLQVVLTAARMAQDHGAKINTLPFYEAAVRDAVRELCYDTPWDDRAKEAFIPENRIMKLPAMVGLKNIFLFNGDQCSIDNNTTLYIKENYSHHGNQGFFANQMGQNQDPLTQQTLAPFSPEWGMYYGGIVDGKLYLSPSCTDYQRIRIEYKSNGQDSECEPPPVPEFAVEAVQYWVARRACELRLGEGNLFANLANRYGAQLTDYNGAWNKAARRYRRMDQKQRNDINLYNNFFGPGPW